jgi:hypothetical protein
LDGDEDHDEQARSEAMRFVAFQSDGDEPGVHPKATPPQRKLFLQGPVGPVLSWKKIWVPKCEVGLEMVIYQCSLISVAD